MRTSVFELLGFALRGTVNKSKREMSARLRYLQRAIRAIQLKNLQVDVDPSSKSGRFRMLMIGHLRTAAEQPRGGRECSQRASREQDLGAMNAWRRGQEARHEKASIRATEPLSFGAWLVML